MKKQSQLLTHDKLFGRGEVPLALRHRISKLRIKQQKKMLHDGKSSRNCSPILLSESWEGPNEQVPQFAILSLTMAKSKILTLNDKW